MSGPIKPDHIDAVIHERVRLAIVSALAVSPELSFNELKQTLSLTDGNLSVHARTLEKAGYLKIDKTFVGRKPRTTMALTRKGRAAFTKYLAQLRRVLERGGGDRPGPAP
jgi:DNA-binding MarR family transcriptional regulator